MTAATSMMARNRVQISDFGGTVSALDGAPTPYNPNAIIGFQTDGTLTSNATPSASPAISVGSTWRNGAPITGIGSLYWVRATLLSGTNPTTGTMGVWTQLSVAQSYANTRASVGTTTSTILFEFSLNSAGTAIIGSATVILRAEAA